MNEPSSHNLAEPTHFQVDACFEVPGVGRVIGGTVLCGEVCTGDKLLLGPEEATAGVDAPAFRLVRVTGIQRTQVDVDRVGQGQHCTLAVEAVEREQVHEGERGGADGIASVEELQLGSSRAVDVPCSSVKSALPGETALNSDDAIEAFFEEESSGDLEALGRSWQFTDQLHAEDPTASFDAAAAPSSRPRKVSVCSLKLVVMCIPGGIMRVRQKLYSRRVCMM